MKKCTFFLLAILLPFIGQSQDKPFVHANVKDYVQRHATMAILPFQIKSEPRKLKEGMTQEDLRAGEKERGIAMQQSMYSYYVRKLRKKELEIQDVDQTNRILKKEGITIDNIFDYEPGELAKILKVDAVMLNKALTDEPLTDAAKGLAFAKNYVLGLGSSKVTTTTSIYDAQTGHLIWRWEITLKGGVMDADDLIENLVENYLSKKSPYRKK